MDSDRRRDRPAQHGELVVDGHPQRLEGALGGVPARTPGRRRDGRVEQLDELGARGERRGLATAYDLAGDLAGELLLAVLAQDAGQLLRRRGVEEVGGGLTGRRVHPHVERGVLGVGEAAVADVELHRGDAEVEEDGVGVVEAERAEHLGQLVVDRVDGGEAVTVRGEPLAGHLERGGVAVDADHPRLRQPLEDGLAVAAEPEGAVDVDRAGCLEGRRQEGDDPVEEHRGVAGRAHRVSPGIPGASAGAVPAPAPTRWRRRTR